MIEVTLEGMQELQAKLEKVIRAMEPEGEVSKWVQYATIEAYKHTEAITHRDTESLAASHRMDLKPLRGMVYIDPSAVNWKRPTHTKPVEYGVYEHNRGGAHAFYARTVQEAGPRIMEHAHYLVKVALQ